MSDGNNNQVPMTPFTGVNTPVGGQSAKSDPDSGANPLPDDLKDAGVEESGLNTDDIVAEEGNGDDKDDIADLGDKTSANA